MLEISTMEMVMIGGARMLFLNLNRINFSDLNETFMNVYGVVKSYPKRTVIER